ncbi:lysophospholipase D GDPD1 isoform X1 [Ahaetulla prasina]|uniref:lysophospholipase D GDPD1 isoform X1 n=2 Tax=Ahaetulla prasina TaxID=499056 RepID=UPI002648E5F6|nr:lysophospholipase D GDPD1 isoform X1 [Ahaetulla prasina]
MSTVFYLLSTLAGYLLTSALLLKFPGLLHRRKRHRFRCRHISHRGGAGENLENTMVAFRHAVNVGTDMLELDCHLTKDEQVVVSHDENLKRSTGLDVNISDLKYSELPPYLCKLEVTFQKECQCEGEDRRIPLLQEVFEAFPHTPVNIDIKVNNDLLIKKVSELVSSYKREHLTVWGSVSHEVVEKCHKENCHIPILFCLRRVLLLLGLFYTGLLPFFPIMEDFLEIPMPSIILKLTLPTARSLIQIGLRMIPPSVLPRLKESEKISKGQRFTIWLIDILLMRKTLFDHLTARGIQVYIWVLNEDQEYKRAFDLGATGVMTDYPTKLKEFLHNYPA